MLYPQTLLFAFALSLLSACGDTPATTEAPVNCTGSNIEIVDSCLLGKTIQKAIEQLQIDTSQFYAFDEPPQILQGIRVEIDNTYEIELLVDRTSIIGKPLTGFRERYKYIADETIQVVMWTNLKTGAHRETYSNDY